jgi:hypothetical protein
VHSYSSDLVLATKISLVLTESLIRLICRYDEAFSQVKIRLWVSGVCRLIVIFTTLRRQAGYLHNQHGPLPRLSAWAAGQSTVNTYRIGVIAMRNLLTLVLALVLLGAATADPVATADPAAMEDPAAMAAMPDRMTCQVFPYHRRASMRCHDHMPGVTNVPAEFRVNNFVEGTVVHWAVVEWPDPHCNPSVPMCVVWINANQPPVEMRATVWYPNPDGSYRRADLFATAFFTNQ